METRRQSAIETAYHRPRLDGFDVASLEQALFVLDLGSFRKAAERLCVQPSVVSRRIRAIEDVLGVDLFHRATRGAQPTGAGLKILQRARRVIDELHLIATVGRQLGQGTEGALCIGIVASIAGGRARDLLRIFLAAHPGIEFSVVEGSPRVHIGDIAALKLDAAIVVAQPEAEGCVVETLWSERIMVALSEAHPFSQQDTIEWPQLFDERFLVSRMDPGPEIQDYIVQHLSGLGRHPIVEPRTVSRDGLLALVGLEQGVTLVSSAEAAVSYPGVAFRPLNDDRLPFSLVWAETNGNPLLRRFLSLARRWASQREVERGVNGQTPDPSP